MGCMWRGSQDIGETVSQQQPCVLAIASARLPHLELAARVGGSIDRNGACYGQFWPFRLQIAFSPQLLRCNFEVFAILAIRVRAVMRFFL
jgi:hypothetical protein